MRTFLVAGQPVELDVAELRRRLSGSAPVPGAPAGDELLPEAGTPLRPASVLVPIVARDEELTMLFTLRTPHLRSHSGQISFPGGRAEPGDASPEHTALRETAEEIGLAAGHVELLGRLPDYCTRTGYCVTPVVGLVMPPFALAPDPGEVEDVFEVPLAFLLDPANHRRESREFQGRRVSFYAMPYGGRYIWGATAGMLVTLYRRLLAAG